MAVADPIARLTELRSALEMEGDKLNDIAGRPADQQEKFEDEARAARRRIENLDAQYTACEIQARSLPTSQGPSAATQSQGRPAPLSMGEAIVESDSYRDWLGAGRRQPLVIERRGNLGDTNAVRNGAMIAQQREQRALIDEGNSATTGSQQWLPIGTPYLNPAAVDHIRLFVQDLLASGQTTLSSVPYIRELNPRTTELGVSSVAEGTAKPELTNTFTRDDAPIRKIAGFVPMTEEIIADAPMLRSYIDDRLRYMVALREEAEILNGNGVSPDLKGILQFTAAGQLQLQASAGTGLKTDTIAKAIALIELVDGYPDGIAINPSDFWALMTYRSAGSGVLDNLNWQNTPSETVLGLRAVRTRQLAVGTCIVGAWRMGGQVIRREEYSMRIGDQHQDYFIKNLLVLLGESRLGLAVHRPDYFVKATLT